MNEERFSRQKIRGLPAEPLSIRQFSYDPASGCLVLVAASKSEGGGLPLVYVRKLGASAYTNVLRLAVGPSTMRGEPVITSWLLGAGSFLYCLIGELGIPVGQKTDSERPTKGRATPILLHSLVRVGLFDLRCDSWLAQDLESTGIAVQSLVGSSTGADEINAVVGVGGEKPGSVAYQLARLSWSGRTIQIIGPMEDIFF